MGLAPFPGRARSVLRALAACTGGSPSLKTLIDAAGIDRRTAVAYDGLLEHSFVTEQLPAWAANRLNRLVRLPKRYLVDPAFVVMHTSPRSGACSPGHPRPAGPAAST